MSRPCALIKCIRASRGLCDCCQKHLCLQHLNEHNATLITQLNPLTDEINALGDRLRAINIRKGMGESYRKLEQWRMDCHQKIDQLFEQKCEELDRLVEEKVKKQQKELVRIQTKIAELIREQETTRQDIDSLTSSIDQLKKQMDNIEQTSLTINARPLLIDDSFIRIKSTNELDLSTLPPVNKTINCPSGNKVLIHSNDRFLLMHQKPNLCLVDQQINIIKEVLWNHDTIYDMCWSATVNRFITIGKKSISLLDENTLATDNVQTIERRDWLSCTCSETSLFLSTNEGGSSIIKFSLLPSIKLLKEWKYPQTCARDEVIDNIKYNNGTLGLIINHTSEKSLRMELRSIETLHHVWSLRFDSVCRQHTVFRCCLLTGDEWLVTDYETKRLLHVTKDGKLKRTISYDPTPGCASLFSNMLVVSRTGGINFHKL